MGDPVPRTLAQNLQSLHLILLPLGYCAIAIPLTYVGIKIGDTLPNKLLRRIWYSATLALFFAPGILPINHGAAPAPASIGLIGGLISGMIYGNSTWIIRAQLLPLGISFLVLFAACGLVPRLSLDSSQEFSFRALLGYLPKRRLQRYPLVGLQIILAAYFGAALVGAHYPLAPDSAVFDIFPQARAEPNRELSTALAKLRKTKINTVQMAPPVEAVAAFGKEAVPFVALLAHERRMNLSLFGIFESRPYASHATTVIFRISDKDAIPELKKLLDDPQLQNAARERLNTLDAGLTKAEVFSMVQKDIASYQVGYRFKEYPAMLAKLDDDAKAEILIRLLQPKALGYEDVLTRISEWGTEQMSIKRQALTLLSETTSRQGLIFLQSQISDLEIVSKRADETLRDEKQMKWFSDAGRERAKRQAEGSAALLVDYRAAIQKMNARQN